MTEVWEVIEERAGMKLFDEVIDGTAIVQQDAHDEVDELLWEEVERGVIGTAISPVRESLK